MMAPCRICGELLMGRPVHEVGEQRERSELAALAAAARQHIAMRHKQLVGALNLVLSPAADYLALKGLVSDDPVFLAARDRLLDDACAVLKSAELVKRADQPPEPATWGGVN